MTNTFIEFVFREFVSKGGAVRVDDVRFVPENDAAGVGRMAQILFGRVVYRKDDDDEYRTTESLAIKRAFDSETHSDISSSAMQLCNEIHFYSVLVPFFQRITGHDANELFPKFLYACTQATPDGYQGVAMFGNLHRLGYRNSSQTVFLDYEHLSLVMRKLGQFHAYSYKAAEIDRKQFNALAHFVPQIHERHMINVENYIRPVVRKYLRLLRRNSEYATKLAAVERVVDDFEETVSRLNEATASPFAVVCHGDCTGANVVFKYENGRPVDAKMLDLGIWRLATPVLDLAHVLYTEADQQTRTHRWRDLLADYRDGLADILSGGDVPSAEYVESQFQNNCMHAAIVATFYIPRKMAMAAKSTLLFETILRVYPRTNLFNREGAKEAIEELVENLEEGGAAATEAVLNVFRDMINRQFI